MANYIVLLWNHCKDIFHYRRIKISPVKITRKCDIAKIADGLNKKARKESIRLTDGLPGSTGSLDIAESVLLRRGHGPKFSSQLENLSTSYISKVFENGKTCAELWKLPVRQINIRVAM